MPNNRLPKLFSYATESPEDNGWVEKDGKLVHEDSGTTVCLGSAPAIEYTNMLALIKGKERYVFYYDKESRDALLVALGRFAGNDELSFSFYDAAVLSQKVRQDERKQRNDESK